VALSTENKKIVVNALSILAFQYAILVAVYLLAPRFPVGLGVIRQYLGLEAWSTANRNYSTLFYRVGVGEAQRFVTLWVISPAVIVVLCLPMLLYLRDAARRMAAKVTSAKLAACVGATGVALLLTVLMIYSDPGMTRPGLLPAETLLPGFWFRMIPLVPWLVFALAASTLAFLGFSNPDPTD